MRNVVYYGNSHSVNIKNINDNWIYLVTFTAEVKAFCLHLFLLEKNSKTTLMVNYINIYKQHRVAMQ